MTVVAGNWKMNNGPAETQAFFDRFGDLAGVSARVMIFPPALSFASAAVSAPEGLELGVQNVHWEDAGAFTGENSVAMAREAGAKAVLIGHSERRHVFGETDVEVARKARQVMEGGLLPMVCVGETLQERRDGRLEEVILRQLDAVLPVWGERSTAEVMVAYEPVWAIGTGETATPTDAQGAHEVLRDRLVQALGEGRGRGIPILYGGSVKPGNAAELLAESEVDGVLVGGASLDPASFRAILTAADGGRAG